ncbi:kinesin-like protein KIF17 [Wyeomyia smithii]|uniref:kinesin-like protein KIF17 n=1 Tax=Wyeomyia smithii TaxID=174621 RepID=UPI002467EE4D|nr:kinesin-like protein KIF17 [Wyeomyia smithii]XP_055531120.1 kinesin-like protein KIF17 [Wyeomyia smithii]XP_055531128.1 kinesin-like protein KIF17 [Wyeomyia smithii]XP_055531138.1 kinesin-like protein KIF17 [Wyeomyia smithii]XP_055531147.1 kinesin-like protein KIF17 [Wyeomyia smithii]XP_055531155.1 kinesin-like protein KIF17 [Wyeomyia smithii]XP_055531163.1 kinesin-like protein KIF17 [Wyeomyia smithii]XP_055531173.1 kinesin-like protein KIF17 [Wyeomyia smithii]XP_055531179.1 kinesin-like
MAENVKVVVRCRPMNKREQVAGSKNITQIDNATVNLDNPNDQSAPQKSFKFDSAYGYAATTENIYSDICYSLVESVLEGYNGTIFAYGQTGCGKSHTMQGTTYNLTAADPNNANNIGIIPRSFEHVFEAIAVASDVRYLVLVSYLEIYNETIRDLLNPSCTGTGSLTIKEVPGEGVTVQGLSLHPVHGMKECIELLEAGAKNRVVGATLMNIESSRSHSIFTISLEQMSTNGGHNAVIKRGKLNLVDLAGSERQSKTGATGERLKEATKINLSLSALGNVISALVDGKTKHVPYRDSKLTRLLQDSLGGNTKTLMIACISPADSNYDETLSTLRYASRAKNIANKPKVNEDPKDTMLREYQQEILRLKQLLAGEGKDFLNVEPVSESSLEDDQNALKQQYDSEVNSLRKEYEQQKVAKQQLVKDIEKIKSYYEGQMQQMVSKNDTEKMPAQTAAVMDKQDIYDRIKQIKDALIGGERANDVQLKEKRYRNKLASQKRLNALAHVISRVEQSEDRDLLQGHYMDIQQELKVRYEQIRQQRKRIKSLERDISDIQSEFQTDRADYLATIRLLEKKILFFEAVFQKAMPVLRKDGRYWNLECLEGDSEWHDDLKKWKLPDDTLLRTRLPPADPTPSESPSKNGRDSQNSFTAPGRLERSSTLILTKLPEFESGVNSFAGEMRKKDFLSKSTNCSPFPKIEDVAMSYFRPRRAAELVYRSGWGSLQK